MKTFTGITDQMRILSALLTMLLLLSALLSGMLLPIRAADAADTVDGAIRFSVNEQENGIVTLEFQIRGNALVRTQCAAIAFDRNALTLISNDGMSGTDTPISEAALTPDTLTALPKDTVTSKNGWDSTTVPSEYGIASADSAGILVLYASRENAVTHTDFTTALTVTFRRNPEGEDAYVPLAPDSIRLIRYAEQSAFSQSVKTLLCTASAHAVFGSLSGGDTLADAAFIGNTPITGARGNDSVPENAVWVNRFTDVSDTAPYYDAVAYVCKNKLFLGSSQTTFSPDDSMTRATFATVLCRLAGEEANVLAKPKPTEAPFPDVAVNAWYTPYVVWAQENGIFFGYGDGRFGPTDKITHEQMYLLVQRFVTEHGYLVKDGANASVSSVPDAAKISGWALDAVKFAFENKLLISDKNGNIRPTEPSARWELAILLKSLSGIERTGTAAAASVKIPASVLTASDTLNTPMASDVLNEAPPASDENVRGAIEKIYEGLLSQTEQINIAMFHLNAEQIKTVYHEAVKRAELFYVGNAYNYSYLPSGEILSVKPNYTMRGAELIAAQAVYREKFDAILAGVDRSWSDFEKVLYLHDYVATHFQYDETLSQYDCYTFLSTGRGVCQSYTMLTQALLDAVGVPNSRVTSDDMNHTWNLVKIAGSWYHMDVTWDDPLIDQFGQVQHIYFLKSDAYMNKHEHCNWYSFDSEVCTNTQYDNAFFTKIRTPFVPYEDGVWYYIDNTSAVLYEWIPKTGKRTKLYQTNIKWVTDEGIYQALYTGLARLDNILLYNSSTDIMAYHIDTGVAEALHTKSGTGYICGMMLEESGNGTLNVVYLVRSSPTAKAGRTVRFQPKQLVTYTLSGAVCGYFADAQVKITLMRNGTAYQSTTLARSGVYQESEARFSLSGVKPGRYDLLIEKQDCFAYTVKNINLTADLDLSARIQAIPLISGDLSRDGVIDENDRALLLDWRNFHKTRDTALTAAADLNGDGIIDIVDYAILTDADRYGCKKSDCTKAA